MAELRFENGTLLMIGENSLITVTTARPESEGLPGKTAVSLVSGKVWANVKKLTTAGSRFEFETPTAVASIRGTRLGVFAENNETRVDVYEGKVMVRSKGGRGEVAVTDHARAVAGNRGVQIVGIKSGPPM